MVSNAGAVSSFPSWFEAFGQWYAGPVPLQLFVFVVAAVAIGLLLGRARFGRYVRAIGYNRETARFTGVPIGRVTLAVYASPGCWWRSRRSSTRRGSRARAPTPAGLELDVIAAVVLGGASVRGGSGTVLATVLGVLIIAVLRNGLFMAGVPTHVAAGRCSASS